MKTVAIICEYNPFHNGHQYQIQEIRRILGLNTRIVCLMSGNFVQRGDLAIFDKHTRARMALLGGADLVIELPLIYAISSAEYFAKGSVQLLAMLGNIDYLCFGSECGSIQPLKDIVDIMTQPNFIDKVKHAMQSGISYPNALSLVLKKPEFQEIIKKPNNTLGIEYMKALLTTDIEPMTIARNSVEHHDSSPLGKFASASYIRNHIHHDIADFIPTTSYLCIKNQSPTNIITIENAILSYLKRKTPEDFKNVPDVTEGLEYKIFESLKKATSLEMLFSFIKSKRYTQSRIRRIILNSYLDITKSDLNTLPPYAKILGFNTAGRDLLKTLKQTSRIPTIIKSSTINHLSPTRYPRLDCLATDLYFMANKDPSKRISGNELTTSPIYINHK